MYFLISLEELWYLVSNRYTAFFDAGQASKASGDKKLLKLFESLLSV